MKRISYFHDCKRIYLIALGLLNDDNTISQKARDLQCEWDMLINKYSAFNYSFPKKILDLITASYSKLCDYFLIFTKLSKIDREWVLYDFENLKLFSYEKFEKKIAKFFIENVKEMNLYSCCYCDAAYTGIYKFNKENKRTFDVDHFFPNALYPFFSICLYNFVPCCQVCNSRVKGSTNFLKLYSLTRDQIKKEILLQLSPTSKHYDIENECKIRIYPVIENSRWNYCPQFINNHDEYKVYFETNNDSLCSKIINSMRIQERYNNIAIKSKALYLLDLKRKYPDSNIKMMSKLISAEDKLKQAGAFQQLKNTIFHKDDKYALLQKLRDDILDD